MDLKEIKQHYKEIHSSETHAWHLFINQPQPTSKANKFKDHWKCVKYDENMLQGIFSRSSHLFGLSPEFKADKNGNKTIIDIVAMSKSEKNDGDLIIHHNPILFAEKIAKAKEKADKLETAKESK